MSDTGKKRAPLRYDLDLDQAIARIRGQKNTVFTAVLIAVLLAIIYLHLVQYNYTATLMVSPVMSSSGSVQGKLRGLSGLASLAGVNIGDDAATQSFMLYQEGLYSRDVANELAKNPELMHVVFHKQWDAGKKQWLRPSGPVAVLVPLVKEVIGIPIRPWNPPDGAALQDYISKTVAVDSDPLKPVVTITYRDEDPKFAVKFLNALNRAVDYKLRNIALVRADEYVDYLSAQLNTVTNADIRQALMSTLSDQEKAKMMVHATAPYAAQPFGPPSASPKPTSPNPTLILFIAVVFGTLFGVGAALWFPAIPGPRAQFKLLVAKLGLGTGQ